MSTLLGLETATDTCGVALLQGEKVTATAHLHRPRVHSEQLTPLIEDVLMRAEVDRADLDAVAVSMGPGSYTGLRIGVSTAKGWALATDASLVGVPTLEAYAAQLGPMTTPGDVICVLLDARRNDVYAGAYRWEADDIVVHAETKALSVAALSEWIGDVDGRLWILGDGGEKGVESLMSVGRRQHRIAPDLLPPSAGWVVRRGRRRLQADGPDDLAEFEPLYVKDVHATPSPSPFG